MGYNLLINGVYWGFNPLTNLLLTSWDIQVRLGKQKTVQNLYPNDHGERVDNSPKNSRHSRYIVIFMEDEKKNGKNIKFCIANKRGKKPVLLWVFWNEWTKLQTISLAHLRWSPYSRTAPFVLIVGFYIIVGPTKSFSRLSSRVFPSRGPPCFVYLRTWKNVQISWHFIWD